MYTYTHIYTQCMYYIRSSRPRAAGAWTMVQGVLQSYVEVMLYIYIYIYMYIHTYVYVCFVQGNLVITLPRLDLH